MARKARQKYTDTPEIPLILNVVVRKSVWHGYVRTINTARVQLRES